MASEAEAALSSSVLDLLSQGSICGSDSRSDPLPPSLRGGEALRQAGQADECLRAEVDDKLPVLDSSEGWRMEPSVSTLVAAADETGECDLPRGSLEVYQRHVKDHRIPMERGLIACVQA